MRTLSVLALSFLLAACADDSAIEAPPRVHDAPSYEGASSQLSVPVAVPLAPLPLHGTWELVEPDLDRFPDADPELLDLFHADLAVRFGGEEFAVLFPETSLETARAALEDVRRAIAGRRFALRAPDRPNRKPERPKRPTRPIRHINLTVSMGLAAPTSSARSPDAISKP